MNFKEIVEMAKTHKLCETGDEFCDYRTQKMLEDGRFYGNKIEPYYSFFYKLSQYLKPKVVVELGGWRGDSAVHFARGTEGTVITIDHHTDPDDAIHDKAMLEAVENCPNLYFIRGWTVDSVAKEQKGKHALGDSGSAFPEVLKILDGRKIDLLFIDSWHQYDYAKIDWEAYSPLLSKEALVICDDIIGGHGPAIGGMRDFWDELPGEKELIDGIHISYPMGFLHHVT